MGEKAAWVRSGGETKGNRLTVRHSDAGKRQHARGGNASSFRKSQTDCDNPESRMMVWSLMFEV